jgi:hypothetical protein
MPLPAIPDASTAVTDASAAEPDASAAVPDASEITVLSYKTKQGKESVKGGGKTWFLFYDSLAIRPLGLYQPLSHSLAIFLSPPFLPPTLLYCPPLLLYSSPPSPLFSQYHFSMVCLLPLRGRLRAVGGHRLDCRELLILSRKTKIEGRVEVWVDGGVRD